MHFSQYLKSKIIFKNILLLKNNSIFAPENQVQPLKKNEAMFKFNLSSTVGLPFAKARLRGLVHS